MNYDFRLLFLCAYIAATFYTKTIMEFFEENSKYKIVAKLSIISVMASLMMFAGTASISPYYRRVVRLQRTQLHPHRLHQRQKVEVVLVAIQHLLLAHPHFSM